MITITLDPHSDRPMYLQIYDHIKTEILSGHLTHPEKLPSSRAFSAYLQVSRSTVDTAYAQLVAEGYIEAREKRGYFVNSILHTQNFSAKEFTETTLIASPVKETAPRCDFNPDAIDTTHFPYSVWKSIGKNQLDNPDNFLSGHPFGTPELRQAIAGYLHGSRGVDCTPGRVIVGAGLDYLLQMLCVLFERKAVIAMEDPGYRSARSILSANGYSVLDIPLRGNAFDVSALSGTRADICYVTPSHQFPLGSVMSISRRQELLSWAGKKEGRYIIEDDHDSEFRYRGRPIPSLQSLDRNQKVIYIGTFSKAISPAIRVGYMVLPESLLPLYKKRCGNFACPVSVTSQAVLREFIVRGYFEKHLNRMRNIYKEKHDRMIAAIRQFFPENLAEISGDNAGLYVILRYHGALTEKEIEKNAEKNGIRLRSLGEYYASTPAGHTPAWLLGFANLKTESITSSVQFLAERVFGLRAPYLS